MYSLRGWKKFLVVKWILIKKEKKNIILNFCKRSYKRYWFKKVKVLVSLIVMVHCSPELKPPNPIFFVMRLLVSVLLSASFERFGVSRMRDFFKLFLQIMLVFFLYPCFYLHRSRDSVSPVCGIFFLLISNLLFLVLN